MNREDIIRMAREAGLAYGSDEKPLNSVTRFAALVAKHEREACAKLCDEKVDAEYAQKPVECMCGICKLGKREWVGLTDEESVSLLVKANKPKRGQQFTTAPEMAAEFGRLVSELLKERNT